MTASLFTESVPRRIANPSEFFTRLYFEVTVRPFANNPGSFAEQTSEWIARSQLFSATVTDENEIAQTRRAYDERRKDGPAGEFEFALRESPRATDFLFRVGDRTSLQDTSADLDEIVPRRPGRRTGYASSGVSRLGTGCINGLAKLSTPINRSVSAKSWRTRALALPAAASNSATKSHRY